MSRIRTIAFAIKDRLEEIPELKGKVVVYRRADIESEFEKRMVKTRGKCGIVRAISRKNRSNTGAANIQSVFTISIFSTPLLTQKDAKDADALIESIEEKLQGWWPENIPSAGGLFRIHCDTTTYPDDPSYDVAVMTIQAPKIS